MYFRKKTAAGRTYLQIVESRREGAAVRQQGKRHVGAHRRVAGERTARTAAALGRAVAAKTIVLDAMERGGAATVLTPRIGPAPAFERVWEETGRRSGIESA